MLTDQELFSIRDPADYPVLSSAIVEDVDILITGGKDFGEVEVEKPEIVTPAEFMEKYGDKHLHNLIRTRKHLK